MEQNLLVMFAPVILVGLVFAVVFIIKDRKQEHHR